MPPTIVATGELINDAKSLRQFHSILETCIGSEHTLAGYMAAVGSWDCVVITRVCRKLFWHRKMEHSMDGRASGVAMGTR